jgi:PAS domain S-box-containing protein
VAVVLITTTVLVSIGLGVQRYLFLRHDLNLSLENQLEQTLHRLKFSVVGPVFNIDVETIEGIIRSEMHQPEVQGIMVLEKGTGITSYIFVKDSEQDIVRQQDSLDRDSCLSAMSELKISEQVIATVEVFVSTRLMHEKLQQKIVRLVLESIILVMFLVLMTGFALRRIFVRPVQQLTVLSAEIAGSGKLSEVNVGKSTELINLTESLFRMRDSIQEKIETLTRSNEELRQSKESFRYLRNYLHNVIDSMPSVLIGVDADGKITQWNSRAGQVIGVDSGAAIGRPLAEIVPSLAGDMKGVHQAIDQHREVVYSKRPRHKDGEIHYEDVAIYPLIVGDEQGAVIRVDDVTDRVRLENMMVQTEKMMSVGGLAAGMAHEVNNPLGIILQAVQNIERRVSLELAANVTVAKECGITVEAIQDYLEKRMILTMLADINEAGIRAADIVANMLQFSRRSESSLQPASISRLIDQTIDLAANDYDLKKKYDFRRIKIVKDYAPDLPEVKLVVTEFEQVILNLLKNAAQAMAEQEGEHRKPTIHIRVYVGVSKKTLWIELEDNGPGMEAKVRKRVFEPFFTTKPVGSGTGLGLSVSYMIITNNHKGTMEVESLPGEGTTFIISLPCG